MFNFIVKCCCMVNCIIRNNRSLFSAAIWEVKTFYPSDLRRDCLAGCEPSDQVHPRDFIVYTSSQEPKNQCAGSKQILTHLSTVESRGPGVVLHFLELLSSDDSSVAFIVGTQIDFVHGSPRKILFMQSFVVTNCKVIVKKENTQVATIDNSCADSCWINLGDVIGLIQCKKNFLELFKPCTAFHWVQIIWGPLFSHLTSGGIDQYALGAFHANVHPVQTNILRPPEEKVLQSFIRKFGLRKMVSSFRTVEKVYLSSYSLYVCKTCKQKFVLMFLESCE